MRGFINPRRITIRPAQPIMIGWDAALARHFAPNEGGALFDPPRFALLVASRS